MHEMHLSRCSFTCWSPILVISNRGTTAEHGQYSAVVGLSTGGGSGVKLAVVPVEGLKTNHSVK